MPKNIAILTGASKGLGKIIAETLSERGYGLIINGRNEEEMQILEKKLKENNGQIYTIIGDLKNKKTLDSIQKFAKEKKSSLLINNAANTLAGIPLENLDEELVEDILYSNLICPIKLIKRIYPIFLENKHGGIININSVFGLEIKKNGAVYSSSKWGLRGFTNSFRIEAEEKGVGVMEVFLTKMKVNPGINYGMDGKEVAEKIIDNYEKGNFGELFFDGRPEQFRNNPLKEIIQQIEIENKS